MDKFLSWRISRTRNTEEKEMQKSKTVKNRIGPADFSQSVFKYETVVVRQLEGTVAESSIPLHSGFGFGTFRRQSMPFLNRFERTMPIGTVKHPDVDAHYDSGSKARSFETDVNYFRQCFLKEGSNEYCLGSLLQLQVEKMFKLITWTSLVYIVRILDASRDICCEETISKHCEENGKRVVKAGHFTGSHIRTLARNVEESNTFNKYAILFQPSRNQTRQKPLSNQIITLCRIRLK